MDNLTVYGHIVFVLLTIEVLPEKIVSKNYLQISL